MHHLNSKASTERLITTVGYAPSGASGHLTRMVAICSATNIDLRKFNLLDWSNALGRFLDRRKASDTASPRIPFQASEAVRWYQL